MVLLLTCGDLDLAHSFIMDAFCFAWLSLAGNPCVS
jgi:hypothetical protein